MKISIIAAIDVSGAISKWNELPWRQDAHVARMQRLTHGHHVIMSRNAYRILPRLDGAQTIVLSNGKAFPATLPVDVAHHRSIFSAIEAARSAGETEVFLVGGFEVFAMGLLIATDLYITRVNTTTKDEARHNAIRFPELESSEWHNLESRGPIPADERNQYSYGYEHRQRYGEGVPRPHQPQQQVFRMMEMCCPNCLKNFSRRAAYVTMCAKRNQKDFFCSRTCRATHRNRERGITLLPRKEQRYTMAEIPCTVCGATVTRRATDIRRTQQKDRAEFFCSRQCRGKFGYKRNKVTMEVSQ